MELGRLVRIDPREIWSSEEEFNNWLIDNIDILAEAIGMDLEVIEVESEVGEFRADIIARDLSGEGRIVIIESQLGRTDHEHLGKIITYAAGRNASAVVWISPEFREEHRSALDWLNNLVSNVMFFGLELEVLKIDDSKPAVRLNIVSKPNEWRRSEAARMTLSGRARLYQEFFQELANRLRSERLANVRRGLPQNWLGFGAGRSGFWYAVVFTRDRRLRVELSIDTGDYDRNKKAFDLLMKERDEIEKEIGIQLEWSGPEPSRRAARIMAYYPQSITVEGVADSPEVKQRIIEWAIDIVRRFKQAFTPRIQRLQI